MRRGAGIWDAAGFLGMSPEVLIRVYGHHHPDFQEDAARKISGQDRDRKPVNKDGQGQMNSTKIVDLTRRAQ